MLRGRDVEVICRIEMVDRANGSQPSEGRRAHSARPRYCVGFRRQPGGTRIPNLLIRSQVHGVSATWADAQKWLLTCGFVSHPLPLFRGVFNPLADQMRAKGSDTLDQRYLRRR
jgi:hypothetical protein